MRMKLSELNSSSERAIVYENVYSQKPEFANYEQHFTNCVRPSSSLTLVLGPYINYLLNLLSPVQFMC